mmetsp:Transcript_22567/g.35690  ORF Transcript_22567/g.35690 Transcript_22567/m.35690 type:complete len:88 (+) Transcript_22567:350-613(+)
MRCIMMKILYILYIYESTAVVMNKGEKQEEEGGQNMFVVLATYYYIIIIGYLLLLCMHAPHNRGKESYFFLVVLCFCHTDCSILILL